jgi:transposase-like protein
MAQKKRRRFSEEQKVAAVRRHLLDKTDVSEICNELSIHPNQFYEWQRIFFENGSRAFKKDNARQEKKTATLIKSLENKIAHKDNVISEIMSEHIALKKHRGEL